MRFERFSNLCIAFFVLLHFLLCYLTTTPRRSLVHQIPVLGFVLDTYRSLSWNQNWGVYAPAPRDLSRLAYTVRYPAGWSPLIYFNESTLKTLYSHFWQRRGLHRLFMFFDAKTSDFLGGTLDLTSARSFFYQQLSDYLCLQEKPQSTAPIIRLYIEIGFIEPFLEPAKEMPKKDIYLLYEQDCIHNG